MTPISNKRDALRAGGFDVGNPTSLETPIPGGVVQHFTLASIYWSAATGAHEVHGDIRTKYHALGGPTGPTLPGFPVTDETAILGGRGRSSDFTNATIYWSATTGAHEVHGDIRAKYHALGGPAGMLGFPLTDEQDAPEGRGRCNQFENAFLYWDTAHPGIGAYVVPPLPKPCTSPAQTHGKWELAAFDSLVVGVHAALLPHDKILFFTYKEPPKGSNPAPTLDGDSAVLDLKTGTRTRPPVVGTPGGRMENLFCSAHAFLEDGRLLVAGGEREYDGIRGDSVKALYIYKLGGASAGEWRHVANCARGRWYPQCATLPDGKVLILGGSVRAVVNALSNWTFEVYDPKTNKLEPERPVEVVMQAPSYPILYVLPSNKVLVQAGTQTAFLDIATRTFRPGPPLEAADRPGRCSRTYPYEGTTVLLPLLPDTTPAYRARVMMIGGAGSPEPVNIDTPATKSCEMLDLGAAAPKWKLVAPMSEPRVMPDAVLLPDGTVFVCNGSRAGKADLGADPVYPAEIYNPVTDKWTTVCHMITPRLYHGTALLLPDGRVMTAGTDTAWNPVPFNQAQTRIEIFSPPYLFAGARPKIVGAPEQISFAQEFDIDTPDAAAIDRVALLRCGSVTHSINSDQRYVGLTIKSRTAAKLRVASPPSGAVAPPGFYLLFVLTAASVPSVGRYIRISAASVSPSPRNVVVPSEASTQADGPALETALANPAPSPAQVPTARLGHRGAVGVGTGAAEFGALMRDLLGKVGLIEQRLAHLDALTRPLERPLVAEHVSTPGAMQHGSDDESSRIALPAPRQRPYHLRGQFLEVCDCFTICPCWTGGSPDEDSCTGVFAWVISEGSIDGIDVAGLTAVSVSTHEGTREGPKQRVMLFVSQQASDEQASALACVFGGQAGGPLGELGTLLGELLGIERAEIGVEWHDRHARLTVKHRIRADMSDAVSPTGKPTTLSDAKLSGVLGSPAEVGVSDRLVVSLPHHHISFDLEQRSAMRGSFSYDHELVGS